MITEDLRPSGNASKLRRNTESATLEQGLEMTRRS